MTMEESFKIRNYYVVFNDRKLKITHTSNDKSIAVVPSSGNSIIIIPIKKGENQFKTD